MMYNFGGGAYGMGGMWIMMIAVFLILLVIFAAAAVAIVLALHHVPQQQSDAATHATGPQAVLDDRLARGEIDVEQYQQLRKAISSAATHGS